MQGTTTELLLALVLITPVSYTHLDVYKRQQHGRMGDGACHVAFQQALVKGNLGLKIVQKGAGGFLEAPGP